MSDLILSFVIFYSFATFALIAGFALADTRRIKRAGSKAWIPAAAATRLGAAIARSSLSHIEEAAPTARAA